MKLVIGLGNPGTQYEKTRHNIGFTVVDSYADNHGGHWTEKTKFKSLVSQIGDVIFVKPTTFMNLSGEAVGAISNFYKVKPSDILVISDDIDLDFGQVRIRQDGGDGGHNGLKSITEHIGSGFWRLRIGVSNELRAKIDASDFVLNKFSTDDSSEIENNITSLTDKVDDFIQDKIKPSSFSF